MTTPPTSPPLRPPLRPMLARLARELPQGDYLYEPKWDGFRCLVFRDGGEVDLRSRNDRPLARYFPEIVAAIRALPAQQVVLDAELLVVRGDATDFAALLARLHPAASRAALLAEQTPASLVAFDLLAVGGDDQTAEPFVRRRATLETVVPEASAGTIALTPATEDVAVAAVWLERSSGGAGGIDGVVAKARDGAYQPGRRAMIKVKHERTADCVVAGARIFSDPVGVASLLLALHDADGVLQHVGVAASFPQRLRADLLAAVGPHAIPLEQHPWRDGFGAATGRIAHLPGAATRWTPDLPLDWLPLRPELVCEVTYDHVDNRFFRHPARFRHWRPDRDAASCRIEQLDTTVALTELLPS